MLSFIRLTAQLSPGDLSRSHAHLEGISNCTKCHELGNKITDEKCLSCHTEISDRIRLNKGYHSSDEVKGKQCIACHSEHNGKDFQLILWMLIALIIILPVTHFPHLMQNKSVKNVTIQKTLLIKSLNLKKVLTWGLVLNV